MCSLPPTMARSNPIHYLTAQLDRIMVAYNCQNVLIEGDLNQYLVEGSFAKLTVVPGLKKQVNISTH